uniref:Uncharacterized protein n=1 Tax=Panagrolaimus sp. JU765 TaxID=591449 RepID=A0AC34QXM1_9BILA
MNVQWKQQMISGNFTEKNQGDWRTEGIHMFHSTQETNLVVQSMKNHEIHCAHQKREFIQRKVSAMDSKENIPERYLRWLNSVIPTPPIQYLYSYDIPKIAVVESLLRKSDSSQLHQPRKVSIPEVSIRPGFPDHNSFINDINKTNIHLPPAHLAPNPALHRFSELPPGNIMYATRADSFLSLVHQPGQHQRRFGMHSFNETLENFNSNSNRDLNRSFRNKNKKNNYNQQTNQSNKGRYNNNRR